MSLQSLWTQMSGVILPSYQPGWQVPIIDGQSGALGYDGTPAQEVALRYVCRAGVKQLTGMQRSDNAVVWLHGPLAGGYNAVQASGIIPAGPNGNAPEVFTVALGIDAWRRRLNRPLHRMIVGFNGIAGQAVAEFDDDNPDVTGTLGTIIRDNHSRWLTETRRLAPDAAPLFYGWHQGEGDVQQTAASYRAAATAAFNDALDDIEAVTGTRPPMLIFQTGGYVNTANSDPYGPTLAQLDLVRDFGAVFAGPMYPVTVWDNIGHADMQSQIIATEIAAYVWVQHELGRNLSLLPGTPVVSGNTITIPFEGLAAGKTLAFDPVDKYATYGGLANHGCEVSGTTVTDVTLSGNAVTITAAEPIAGRRVSIAMQRQDMRPHVDGSGTNYLGHRCDIMESDPEESLLVTGQKLKRFLPSIELAVP